MKKGVLYSLVALAALGFAACSGSMFEPSPDMADNNNSTVTVPAGARPGRIIVKMKEPLVRTKAGELFGGQLGSCTVTRTFRDAGKFEARHRKYGLHLWYTVDFGTDVPMTKAVADISNLEGVEHIDFDFHIQTLEEALPFNDPRLGEQWHYHNDGSTSFSAEGSDMNVFEAWTITTGAPEVIVAVCDGGVDYAHEDLAANMWTNKAEQNGQTGVDDDNNGYVDDIYGYNFVDNGAGKPKGQIQAHEHGTHVAGTIAAVNNNGKGVAGMAGGNGHDGVRIMSVQTIDNSGNGGYIGDAIVYAADNGAILMNCSWGLKDANSTPQHVLDAFDYFNAVAGMDENDVQTGPMAGGAIFFASGNENSNVSYPGMEESVSAVSAIGADFIKASYSNYGEWVDFTATGGESSKGQLILSTVPNNQYAGMQGTSMASPHATGAAALVLSRFMGEGFTREKLLHIMNQTANRGMYSYNQGFVGRLGVGLIDTYAAVAYTFGELLPITDFRASAKSNEITVTWKIPGEPGQGAPYRFRLYFSESSLEGLDPANVTDAEVIMFSPGGNKAAEDMSYVFSRLEFEKEYHFRILSEDFDGNFSPVSEEVVVRTPANGKPVIEALTETSMVLKAFEQGVMQFNISDPDGHEITYRIEGMPAGVLSVSKTPSNDMLTIILNAVKAEKGRIYSGELIVSDSYDETRMPITYEVLENNAPAAIGVMPDVVFNSLTDKTSMDLRQFFSDADGEPLSYNYTLYPGKTIANFVTNGDIMEVSAFSYGSAEVEVTATDANGAKAKESFMLLVRDGSRVVDLYPNPVKRMLNVRTGENMKVDLTIVNKAGAKVMEAPGTDVGPFSVKQFDFEGLPGGVYYVKVSGSGIDETYSIVKN